MAPIVPVASEITRRREVKGWTQQRLAERAGCSLRTVQRAEHGTAVRAQILAEIAGALECNEADISSRGSPPADAARTARTIRNVALVVVAAAALFHIREGQPQPPAGPEYFGERNFVVPGYFRTLGIALIRGRAFDCRDDARAPPVAVINVVMARQMFGDEDPIGKRIWAWQEEEHAREIVGVVDNVTR